MRRHDAYTSWRTMAAGGWILVASAMLMGAPAWAADSNASPTVSLTQAVHFMDAKGQDLVVGPGEYRVEAAGKSGLTLTPADGKEPIIIQGQAGSVKTPAALSVPVNENEHHVVLLLPKGKTIDVAGSPSGVRSRSFGSSLIDPPHRKRKGDIVHADIHE